MSLAAVFSRLTKLSDGLVSDLARLQAASELFLASLACDDDNYTRQAAAGGVSQYRAGGRRFESRRRRDSCVDCRVRAQSEFDRAISCLVPIAKL